MEINGVILPQVLYKNALQEIGGIKFTSREATLIACFISGRSAKTIASFLEIAPKTVETHTRNIMHKLGCNSREGIINFVEKSGNYKKVKVYYFILLARIAFTKILKEIQKQVPGENGKFFIHIKDEFPYLFQELKKDLKVVGINIVIRRTLPSSQSLKGISIETIDNKMTFNNKACSYYEIAFEILKKHFPEFNFEPYELEFKEQVSRMEKGSEGNMSKSKTNCMQNLSFLSYFPRYFFIQVIFGIIILGLIIVCWKIFTQPTDLIPPNNGILEIETKEITWNLPLSLNHYTERPILTHTIWNNFNNINEKKTATLAGLHGLGGVGKTTLAAHLVRNPNKNYEFRGWFSAETKDLLKDDYFALGDKFHLFSKDMSDELKINIVREWLENKKSALLVYDNAPDIETLKDFLPNNGHIIITSRNYNMPGAVEIDVMRKDEALSLLAKLLPNKSRTNANYQQDANKLVKTLGYLPLALSQAGGYIHANMMTIADYLSLYETDRNSLLSEKSLPPGDQHEPVYVTWDITIKKLQSLPNGDNALKLLDFISYCYPENIPKKLLEQYLYGKTTNEEKVLFNKNLQLLRQYSLVKLSTEGISIHRLLHDWIKRNHTKELRLTTLRKGMNAVIDIYPFDKIYSELVVVNIDLIRDLIPHIQSILLNATSLMDPFETITFMSILGNSYETLGDYHKSKKLYEKVLTLYKKYFGASHIKTADILFHLGWAHYYVGNFQKSRDLFETALKIIQKHYGLNHIKTAEILRSLGWVYLYFGEYVESNQHSKRALEIVEKHYGSNHVETALTLRELGRIDLELGNYNEGHQRLQKSLEILENKLGKYHLETARGLRLLGRMYFATGQYIGGTTLIKRALNTLEKYYGFSHVETSKALNDLGWQYLVLGQYDDAKALLERAFSIREKYYGIQHMKTANVQYALGLTQLHLNNFDQAKHQLEKALSSLEKHYGSDHVEIVYGLNSIGIYHSHKKEYGEASYVLMKAVNIATNAYNKNNVVAATLNANLGNLQRLLNNLQDSKKLLEESLEFLAIFHGADNLHVAMVRGNLGLLYGDLGDNNKKKEYLTQALVIFKKQLPQNHPHLDNLSRELEKMERENPKNDTAKSKSLGYFIIL